MFETFFSDPDLIYRINVINSIDFYSLGFEMVRGETKAENMLQWLRKGEVADVLVTNVQCPDMSGFELAETVRKYCPRVRVIFLADTPNCVIAQQVVRFGAYDFLLKSDGIDALRAALSRAAEELCAERRENAYLRSQTNWDEIIPKLLRLLTALRPEICEEHWQLYSRIETLLVRALMEELRMEIRRRDEALFLQIRSSIMDTPLEELTSTHAVAKQIDTIWKLLAEKGYITPEDALKSDTIGRACVYMQTHLGEKLTAESVAAYAHISSRHFVRKFRAEMNETFAEYLLRIRIKAAIGMLARRSRQTSANSHMHRTGRLAALPQGSACQSKKSRGGTETVCGHIWQVQTQTYPAGSYL